MSFPILDKPSYKTDVAIGESIMMGDERLVYHEDFGREKLLKFFAYIRRQPEPILQEDIVKYLGDVYAKARQRGSVMERKYVDTRFMDAVKIIVKAIARMRMSKAVAMRDIEAAFKILEASEYNENFSKIFPNPQSKDKEFEEDMADKSLKDMEVKDEGSFTEEMKGGK
jgi:DNA replicative helicase MCM subunit Mcm2 (Cdc46/Mcm family)